MPDCITPAYDVPPTHPHAQDICMLAHATIGSNDLPRAAAFYDEVLGIIGAKRVMENEQFIA